MEHRCTDLVEFLEWVLRHRKELNIMATVQFSATFNVSGGTQPLAVNPSSGTFNLTVGTASDGTAAATVSGGVPPYSYALDANSGPLPTGVTFAEDASGNITLTGTPTVAGTSSTPVLLNISDTQGATAQFKMAKV